MGVKVKISRRSFLQFGMLRFGLLHLLCFVAFCGFCFMFVDYYRKGGNLDSVIRMEENIPGEQQTLYLWMFCSKRESTPRLLVVLSSPDSFASPGQSMPANPDWLIAEKPSRLGGFWDIQIKGRRFSPQTDDHVRVIIGSQYKITCDTLIESERYRQKFGEDFSGSLKELVNYAEEIK
tara:strand:- start:3793 stop:4326 length:534 start_codon:yes stop_codon:yes gene_type:complete